MSRIDFSEPDLSQTKSAFRHYLHLGAISISLAMAQSVSGSTASTQNVQTLEPGHPVEKRIAGGESHSYSVGMIAGQFLRAVIDQRGIDVTVTLSAPDGKELLVIDSPNGEEGPEPISWIAEVSGNYRIEVRPGDKQAKAGRYEARIDAIRVATEADRTRVAAERRGAEAEALLQGDLASKRQALTKFEEALGLWRRLDDQSGMATALNALGDTHAMLNQHQLALENYLQAAPLWRALRDQAHEGAALHEIGARYDALNEREKALDFFNQALAIRRSTKNQRGEANALHSIGNVYLNSGETRKAIDYFTQALPVRRAARDSGGEALTLNNLGRAYFSLGEKKRALRLYEQALTVWRALGNRAQEAQTLNNIGAAYSDLGAQQQALDFYNRSLPLRRDPRGRAITFNNIGRSYDLLGAPQEALNYYNQSLQLLRGAPDKRLEGQTLNYIGLAHWQSGDYLNSLEVLNQALNLRRETLDRTGEAATLNNIGLVYDAIGERRKALDIYTQALRIFRETANHQGESYALNNLGFVFDALGDKQQALANHEQALKLSREIGDRLREAKAHYGVARIQSQLNNLKQARDQIELSVKIVESLRSTLANQELRAAYRASTQRYYELYIDVLMRMGKRAPRSNLIAEALQVNERSRARLLIELLNEAGAEIREGVEPGLIERERELQEQINDKTTEQIRLMMGKKTSAQVAGLADEIERSVTELRETQAQIRKSSPRYAALTQPQPLTAQEIQRNLLDANTMLLEYSLGADRSYLWAVTRNSILSFTLPGRDEIETRARRYYELINQHGHFPQNETNQKRQSRLINSAVESRRIAAWLSRTLLGPITSTLGSKRLIIVADGALQYTPFAALPSPVAMSRRPAIEASPLIVGHEIIMLPSASTLDVLRREMSAKPKASNTVALIADPVFEAGDERVKRADIKSAQPDEKKGSPAPTESATEPSRVLLVKSAKDSGASGAEFSIPRLPNTRIEAEAILSLDSSLSGGAGKSVFDFAASRAEVTSADLGQYRIIHLATHGFLNSFNPELSGLAFSLVDEKGSPKNGLLLAPEIYNLKFPGADLIVLSACQTGLGKEIRGEGVVGLTRGFMYAGAPRVIVSLWNVNDRATAELMKKLYQGMLIRNLPPAAALRAAQIEMFKQRQWREPYYWAAFGLQGEWR